MTQGVDRPSKLNAPKVEDLRADIEHPEIYPEYSLTVTFSANEEGGAQ